MSRCSKTPLPAKSAGPLSHFRGGREALRGGARLFLAARDDAEERSVAHDFDHAGHRLDGREVDRHDTRGIGGRARNRAEQHAGGPQVVDEDLLAEHLGGDVGARVRGADDLLLGSGLSLRRRIDGARERHARSRVAKMHARAVRADDRAVFHPERGCVRLPGLGRGAHQRAARIGARVPEGRAAVLHRKRPRGHAFVGRLRGVARNQRDARGRHVEFLRCDLAHRRQAALADLDAPGEHRHRTVGRNPHPCIEVGIALDHCREVGDRGGLALRETKLDRESDCRGCCGALDETAARERYRLGAFSHGVSRSLPGGPEDRADHARLAAAAAEVGVQHRAHVGFGRGGLRRQSARRPA